MTSRKVVSAKLHQNYHIQNVGEFSMFPPSGKTLDNLTMEADQYANLEVNFSFKGSKSRVLIPSANIAGMVLYPEPVVMVVKKSG